MSTAATTLGPHDHGRRLSLDEFDGAVGTPGSTYELGSGIATVIHVLDTRGLAQVAALRRQLPAFDAAIRDTIHTIDSGGKR